MNAPGGLPKEEAGRRLKEAIALSGLSQAEVARRLEVKASTVGNWVSGYSSPQEARWVYALDEMLRAGGRIVEAYGLSPVAAARPGRPSIEEAIGYDERLGSDDKRVLLQVLERFLQQQP